MKRQSLYCISSMLFFILWQTISWAGVDPAVVKTLDGNLQQIKKDSFSLVEDSKFFDPALNSILVKPYRVQNKIALKLNEASSYFFQANFTATVQIRVYSTRFNLSVDSVDKTLSINYSATGAYLQNATYYFSGAYRVKAKVLSISSNVAWDPWKGIILVNELQSYPAYTFSCTNDAVHTLSNSNLPSNTTADELSVSWESKLVADEYDLEWAYIDSSALQNGRYGNAASPDVTMLFDNNSSRVTVKATTYSIPLLYDGSGTLFYRVRSIQLRTDGSRSEAAWSSDFTGGLGRFDFKGHARNLNWQATTSYAEDGKRKSVVQYYDGGLYSRQVVTKDNTTNTTIVAESIYDYQGRPVIQVLPAPTLNSIIQYTQSFNTALNGSSYDRDNFDLLPDPAAYCSYTAAPMDTLTGAAQYYSSNNPLKGTDIHKYIPDAKGYPFTQVEYTPDNTGRISRQSGVGPMFKLGSGHETKYYYGTPDQRELDALFGTEAGHYSHYFKTMARDANGQFSVSYTDMLGRTVATALAGTPPDSIKLDLLSSNTPRTITETISDPKATVIKGLVMENKKGLLVSRPGLHQFSYQLSPQSLQLENCNADLICYDCLYDLEITITDDCNNQKLGGQPFDTVIHNFSISAIDTTCANPAQGFSVNFSRFLEEGSYEITKKLSVSSYGLDYLKDSVYLKNNTCKTLGSFIQEQREILALNQECKPSCQSCTDSLGTWETFRIRFLQGAGVVDDTASYRSLAQEAYNRALEACNELCRTNTELDAIRAAMLLDLTPPSGQYGNPDSAADKYSIFFVPTDAQGTPTGTSAYRKPTNYADADGNPDLVYDEQAGAMVPPQDLSPEAFVQKFKLSWALALLPYHPEFCKLNQYELLGESHKWDRRFEATETFREALDKGYLNPTNNSSAPFSRFAGTPGLMDPDPLSSLYNNGTNNYKQKLETQLREFRNNNFGSSAGMSMWGLATVMTLCATDTSISCYTQHGTDNAAFDTTAMCTGDLDMAWRSFRQMYLDIKKEIINAQLTSYCNGQPGAVTTSSLVNARHQVHFSDAVELLQLSGVTLPTTQAQANASQQQAQNDLGANNSSSCASYAAQWWQQMKPCNFTAADSAFIISRLIAVCTEGTDMSHPMGASSVKPSSTYRFKSFRDVLQQYCDSTGKTFNSNACNAYLITSPAPYDGRKNYSDLVVLSKPDTCQCTVITKAFVSFTSNSGGYLRFSDYVNSTFGTSMTEEDLQALRAICNSSTCNNLEKPIRIPPPLQCGALPTCVSCDGVATAYSQFLHDYLGASRLTVADSISVQQYSNLLSNYLNTKLGFKKSYNEYISFFQSCGIPYTAPSTTAPLLSGIQLNIPANTGGTTDVSCDTLQSIVAGFTATYPNLGRWNTVTTRHKLIFYPTIEYMQAGGGILTYTPSLRTTRPLQWTGSGQRDSGYTSRWYRDTLTFVRFDFSAFPGKATVDSANLKLSPLLSLPFNPDVYWCNMATVWDTTFVPLSTAYNGYKITSYTPAYQYLSAGGHTIYSYDCRVQLQGFIKFPTSNKGSVLTSFLNPATTAHNTESFVSSFDPVTLSDPQTRPRIEVMYRTDTLYSCKDLIASYFNYRLNTNLSYDSVVAVYQQKCGSTFPLVCPGGTSGLQLCGNAGPLFPSVKVEDIDNCSDTAFFAISKGTELYNVYRDSLNNVFDSTYRARCLGAYKYETFTVTHDVSEYHYTLYYYDQAGNLVKTVSPEGVQPNYTTLWLDSVKTARDNGQVKVPAHGLLTQYRYNTLNGVTIQQSPDGGKSYFWYDRLGRLAVSQNAKQKAASATEQNARYSYTLYDPLGRITEVGQIANTTTVAMTDSICRGETLLSSWISNSLSAKEQITQTVYDVAYAGFVGISNAPVVQRNLRNRVSYTSITLGNNPAQYNQATFYTYDAHGNVDTLLQDYGNSTYTAVKNVMNSNNNRFKKLVYRYDLISGKINSVAYQPKQADQFYHRYSYDAENKLTLVETSYDSLNWEKDARYQYYKHGPLARLVLGDQQVQGLDYAYTLQGWLKGVNSTSLDVNFDMGADGKIGAQNQFIARDAYGFNLNYFTSDYTAISRADIFPAAGAYLGAAYKPLYNGNISSMAVNIGKFTTPMLYSYTYDQLNRLKAMDAFTGLSQNSWSGLVSTQEYKEQVTYDANGNILTYVRNGVGASNVVQMDNLTYNYNRTGGKLVNNQLNYIADPVSANRYTVDIDNQSLNNYTYDEIGNLTKDNAEKITAIIWNVYGKIQEIQRTSTTANPVTNIQYTYDAAGNRISKRVAKSGTSTVDYTWYVRDAQGNVMVTYNSTGTGTTYSSYTLLAKEQHLFGSSRLGVVSRSVNMKLTFTPPDTVNFFRGIRSYELTNHLGNVLVTISDKKLPHNGGNNTIDYFTADVQNASDYYPFGMLMPNRTYTAANGYRYGFNGKEMDNDTYGQGNEYNYGFRIYNSRIGRFLSVDALTRSYPWYTPYQFAGNKPIVAIDLDGLEEKIVITDKFADGITRSTEIKISNFTAPQWRAIQQGLWQCWSEKENAKGYKWTGGYAQFTMSMGGQNSGWYGPWVGTLTINKTKSVTTINYDKTDVKGINGPKAPPVSESIKLGWVGFKEFWNDEGVKEVRNNVLTGFSLIIGLGELKAGIEFWKVVGVLNDVDDLLKGSENIKNKDLKTFIDAFKAVVNYKNLQKTSIEGMIEKKLTPTQMADLALKAKGVADGVANMKKDQDEKHEAAKEKEEKKKIASGASGDW